MLRIAEDCLPNEVRKTAGFFVGDGAGITHQHQPVGCEGLAERRVDVLVGVGDEPQPLVEVQAADRNVVYGRVDLEDDAPDLPAEGLECGGAHVLSPQGG